MRTYLKKVKNKKKTNAINHPMFPIAALPLRPGATRWSILSADETDDVEQITGARLVSTRMAAHVHSRSLFQLLQHTQVTNAKWQP